MRQFLLAAAGISGAAAVALGAIGAHAIAGRPDDMREIWKTAVNYHFIHSCALAIVALSTSGRKQKLSGTCFLFGIILFSGSCYTVAYMNQRKPYSSPAPFGGMLLIAGWLALGLA